MKTSNTSPEIRNVLVIDDSEIIIEIVTEHLKSAGYKVTSAPDGKSGLKALKQNGADIVVTDIVMPPPDGLKVLETIKKNHPEIPVIVLSGQGGLEDVKRALKLGAYDYLTKANPGIDRDDLTAAVHRAWDKLKLTREIEEYKNDLEAKVTERTRELERTKEIHYAERQISDKNKSDAFKKLEHSERKYKTLMVKASVGIATVRPGGEITALNDAFVKTLGFKFKSDLQDHSIYDNKYLRDSGVVEKILRCFEHKKEASYEIDYVGSDGKDKVIEYTLTPIQMDEHGFEVEVLFTVNDVTLERKEKERLTVEATYDGLTGLIKQEKIIPKLNSAIEHAKKNGYLLGVAHIDLDDFSKINSKYGHPAASEVLGLVGQRIKSSIQQERDLGFRSGGDEFVIVLPIVQTNLSNN